ncbi:MAG: tRNA (adenosine(37)-N6)-threonylcarbamoyltransferase complex dimerization subunit type 1 TsaB [Candidatus Omnitrophota bacterium]|jgi:tRNA threonylcarbamoyladenosine biosynthesis protein TsaB
MKILALDSTTKILTLGIYNEGAESEYNLEVGRKLSQLIDKSVERVLAASGITLGEIDYFTCGLGPGSFTGMRVSISFIKGLSWANKKPVIGISTLDIIAQQVKEDNCPIVSAIDARRNLIYACIYKKKSGRLKKISPYMLLSIGDLLKKVPEGSLILGDALSLYAEDFLKVAQAVRLLEKEFWYPRAHNLVRLALEKIKKKQVQNAFSIKPLYLYPKECQIK